MSYISGNITFCDNSVNLSSSTGQINGIACFLGGSVNDGTVACANFYSNSNNLGVVYNANFNDSAINNNIIIEQAVFCGTSCNNSCVSGFAIFSGDAVNCGSIIGVACFYGSSLNSGIVTNAYFNDNASNLGSISGSGLFFGTSINSGIISGNAIFADTTINNGTVEGGASFATGASNEGGSVSGSTGIYTPPFTGVVIEATNWTNYSNRCWFNLDNWFNTNYINNANSYPLSSANVIMSGNCAALTPLDCNLWVKPASINTTLITESTGIYFYSSTGYLLSGINISGNATFGANTILI